MTDEQRERQFIEAAARDEAANGDADCTTGAADPLVTRQCFVGHHDTCLRPSQCECSCHKAIGETMKGICFVCQGGIGVVTEMTDGKTTHLVCDGCRELVTPFFYVYGNLTQAVHEAAQAKRGSKE